jgi:xanthine dehydrogenase YagS FAD-binding subunit
MNPFQYARARDVHDALEAGRAPGASYVAGGTSLLDLMKLGVEQPARIVDVNAVQYQKVEETADGISIGALVRNSDAAEHPLVKARYPALAQALLSGASPQLRNMASMAGNLRQRTRCPYFREMGSPCNKRRPGSGCAALEGYNRVHAILGVSSSCIAVHPSDLCVALVAFDASVHTERVSGRRVIPMADFHRLPADHPEIETVLEPGEFITHITLPAKPFFARSCYVKARDRASFAFALASSAVALDIVEGKIADARVAVGGVATKPWRCSASERALVGAPATAASFERAAAASVAQAQPRKHNAFKVELLKSIVRRALSSAAGIA